jgi:hypothetical protein
MAPLSEDVKLLRQLHDYVEVSAKLHHIDSLRHRPAPLGVVANIERRAASAIEALLRTDRLSVIKCKCVPTKAESHGRLWSSSWRDPDSAAIKEIARSIAANWDRHTATDQEHRVFCAKNRASKLAELVASERSEAITARLIMSSLFQRKLADSFDLRHSWTLLEAARFIDHPQEIAAPLAKYSANDEDILVCIPVPPFWFPNAETAVLNYTEQMFEGLNSRHSSFEIWIPFHHKAYWPTSVPRPLAQ